MRAGRTMFRHREDGYEVKAKRHGVGYYVRGYIQGPPTYEGFIGGALTAYFAERDFNKLFEPVLTKPRKEKEEP